MKSLASLLFVALAPLTLSAEENPRFIAHRGASHAAPENTISAMQLAWKENADGIEGDFHLSSDGEVVCIHDADTLRTTGTKLIVKDTPWADLEKLDAGTWKSTSYKGEKIPRFADVLDQLPAGKIFYVEVKSGPATIAPIKAVLDSRKGKYDPAKVVIISFDPAVIEESRKLLPEHEAHLVASTKNYGQPGSDEQLNAILTQTGAHGFQFGYRPEVTGEWMAGLKNRGLKLTSWTVNDPAYAADLISKGIQFITTDRPGPLRKELTEKGILK